MIRIDPPPAPWLSRLQRRLRRHRRPAASAAAAAATLILGWTVVSLVSPASADIVVASRPVPAGTTLTDADVAVRSWPVGLVPEQALTDPAAAVGGASVTSISRGEPLTAVRLTVTGAADLDGRVTVVAGLADPWSAELVGPGSLVDVYPAAGWTEAAGSSQPPSPLAREAVVIRLLGAGAGPPAGIDLGVDSAVTDGVALVLAVRTAEVAAIAGVAGQGVAISTSP